MASTIATRIGLSLGLQGLQIIYVDQINDSSSSSSSSSIYRQIRYLVSVAIYLIVEAVMTVSSVFL